MNQEIEDVMRKVIQSLKTGVSPNVVMTTHTEYTELAELPAVLLFYPLLEDYAPNELNEQRITLNADQKTTTIRPPKIFKNLAFQVQLLAESILGPDGLAQLQSRFEVWMKRNATIEAGGITYDVFTNEPTQPLFTANLSNIKRLDTRILVEGVELDDAEAIETGYAALESKVTSERKE